MQKILHREILEEVSCLISNRWIVRSCLKRWEAEALAEEELRIPRREPRSPANVLTSTLSKIASRHTCNKIASA
jgi:hypothetical protein